MAWFLVRCMGIPYDGKGMFSLGHLAYSEGESVEERAQKWGLQKADPSLGLPDLWFREALTAEEMGRRNLHSIETNGYTIKQFDGRRRKEIFVCRDSLVCTTPIRIGRLD